MRNSTVKEVLKEIENLSEFTFYYNDEAINSSRKVSIQAKSKTIEEILSQILSDCDYQIDNRNIILTPAGKQQDQTKKIEGRVLDELGESIIGANVMVEGSMVGVITDFDGNFSLEVKPDDVLLVSYIGYLSQRKKVGNENFLLIQLQEDLQKLDEVVVVGYGTQRKVSVTGAIASTSGDDLAKIPTTNVTNTLTGRLPGLVSYNRSGEPGYDDATLCIRGVSTTGNSDPLVVVDGVADRAGSFNRLDPNDIESISIPKDASAAIYGSRAANGVILVTTKRGKSGKTTVNYTGNVGMSSPTRLPQMAESWQYAELRNEIRTRIKNEPAEYTPEEIEKFRNGSDPLNYPNIDIFDLMLKKGLQTQHNVSLSGGNEIVTYFASLGYQYQDNYYKNSASNYNQYNLRSNIDIKPHKNAKIGINIAARQEDRNSPVYGSEDIWRYMIKYDPRYNVVWPGTDYPTTATQDLFNPVTAVDNTMGYTKDKRTFFNADITAHLDMPYITEGLSFDAGMYIDRYDQFWKKWENQFTLYAKEGDEYIPRNYGPSNAKLNQNMREELGITFNTRLNYNRIFNSIHNLGVFVAYEQYKFRRDHMEAYRQDFVSTLVDQLFAGDKSSSTNTGTAKETARQNYFGRVDYGLKDRYLFQFNWRYDGSENFPSGNRFGFFPGVSLGWRISEEEFWKNNVSWMDYLKLRASWEQMGNDQVDPFQYITAYTFSNAGILGGAPQTGVALNRTANPYITWEVANSYNVGIETMFLNNFTFEVDLFKNKRKNILATRANSFPDYAGLKLPDENIGECSSWGTEIVLGYSKAFGDFRLRASGNFTYTNSRIDFIDEPGGTLEWQKRTGNSIGTDGSLFLMYDAIGIFRTQEDLDKYPHLGNAQIGDLIFRDVNEDGVIDGSDKIRENKPEVPRIMYGINLGFEYKDWSLNMLFQGAAQVWQYTFMEAGIIGNFTKDFYENRWTENNPNATYPKVYDRIDTPSGGGDYRTNFWLNNASYLRLKNIELSYSLPRRLLEATPLSNVRFSLSGYNLLTFTGIKNIDPEVANNSQGFAAWSTPQSKVINFGVNVTF